MNKTNSKILFILLFALLFISTGLFISMRLNRNQITDNPSTSLRTSKQQITNNLPILSLTATPPPTNLTPAKVLRVIDGDTIELADKTRVRYIGINTPELATGKQPAQCYATEAAHINQQLVEGQEVYLGKDLSDHDKYGRLLRYVYIDSVFINDFMLRQGYARLETIPPDVKYAQTLLEAEKEARNNKRGLWKAC